MPHEISKLDRVRLTHMLQAAEEAIEFLKGKSRPSLDAESMLRRAVIHCVQEIGEAAVRVAPETRALASNLPWNQIVGMRHRLVHVYFDINLDFVWEVVVRDLPVLVTSIKNVLQAPPLVDEADPDEPADSP